MRVGVGDTGVVDQDVQLAEPAFRGMYRFLPVGVAGHVEMDVDGLAAGLRNPPLHRLALVVQQVAEDHLGALGGEQFRLQCALPARSA